MTWNQTIIVGNLGADPESKFMQDGSTSVCNFSVAVSEKWTDKTTNEKRDKTTWFRIAVWGKQAESCQTYLKKGSQVMVVGTVEARAYMHNGEAKASLDLRAKDVKFLSSSQSERPQNVTDMPTQAPPPQENDDTSIPF